MFKVAVVGQVGVGKTTLIHEIAKVGNQRDIRHVRVDDVHEISEQVRGKQYGIQFWDTAGSERYQALPPTHYKNAKMIVMIYDVDSASSFQRIRQYWSPEVQERTEQSTLKLVLGNKLDSIPRDSAVDMEEVTTFCDEKKYLRYTLSSRSPENVRLLRQFIALSLVRKLEEEETRQVSQVPLEESEIDRLRSNTKSTAAPIGHHRDKRSVLEDYDDVEVPKRKRWCC